MPPISEKLLGRKRWHVVMSSAEVGIDRAWLSTGTLTACLRRLDMHKARYVRDHGWGPGSYRASAPPTYYVFQGAWK